MLLYNIPFYPTVSPDIEPKCIPTACNITQGNGACLINKYKEFIKQIKGVCI